jgi:hypothetical protein
LAIFGHVFMCQSWIGLALFAALLVPLSIVRIRREIRETASAS